MQRWYVDVLEGTLFDWDGIVPAKSWKRMSGRWLYQAAIVKARETAIAKGTWTRVVKAR